MRISLPNPTQFSKTFESALGKPLNIELTGIATDSREVQKDDLYIAISVSYTHLTLPTKA